MRARARRLTPAALCGVLPQLWTLKNFCHVGKNLIAWLAFDDLGNFEVPRAWGGGRTQSGVVRETAARGVIAKRGGFAPGIENLSHGLDLRCVKLIELFDVSHDFRQVLGILANLIVRQPQVGQIGDVANFFIGNLNACRRFREVRRVRFPAEPALASSISSAAEARRGGRAAGTFTRKSIPSRTVLPSAAFSFAVISRLIAAS